MDLLKKYLWVMVISAAPIVELRGAVPIGVGMDLPILAVLAVSVIGNMLPVPIIILFVRRVFDFMKKKSGFVRKLVDKLEKRAADKAEMIYKYELLGLYILVAIPLPGTGAWTGSLVAAMLDIRLKAAFPVILAGVATAGVIMAVISYGFSALFAF